MSTANFAIRKENAPFLVTGVTGPLGQAVLRHLLDTLHVEPKDIIAGSRHPEQLSDLAARGVQVRRVDYQDLHSVAHAARGVKRALLMSLPHMENPDPLYQGAITVMVQSGVQHILFTSYHACDKSIDNIGAVFHRTEQFIRQSGVAGYTMLRNGMYFENQLLLLSNAVQTGKWFTAARDGKIASIARDDLALANAVALVTGDDNDARQVYQITGVKAKPIDEIVGEMSSVVGKPIEVVHLSEEELLAQMQISASHLPPHVAALLVSFDANTAAGNVSEVTDDFKRLTGRDPMTHLEWLQANKSMLPISEA